MQRKHPSPWIVLLIRLWMMHQGEADICIQLVEHCSPYSRGELGYAVWEDVLRNAVVPENMGEESVGSLKRCWNTQERYKAEGLCDWQNQSTTTILTMADRSQSQLLCATKFFRVMGKAYLWAAASVLRRRRTPHTTWHTSPSWLPWWTTNTAWLSATGCAAPQDASKP